MGSFEGYIGVFDSGAGGISVLKALIDELPHERFVFFGDSRYTPYGDKPASWILDRCRHLTQWLLDEGCKAIVIACNTATSAYAEIVRAELDMPIVGMEPAIKPAQLARRGGEVIALATKATLTLPKFQRLMESYGEAVVPVIGEGLVELVESGQANTPQADAAIERLLQPYMDRSIDSIVLGCTHYPFLTASIRKVFPNVPIFDGREGTAMRLKSLLDQNGLRSDNAPGTIEYQTSGSPETLDLMRRLMASLDSPK